MAIQSISNATDSKFSTGASSSTQQVSHTTGTQEQASSDSTKSQQINIEHLSQNQNEQDNQQTEVSNEKIKRAVADLNKRMSNSTCQLSIHDATNRLMIKIVDNETKEVIREYPAEETLDIIAKAWELAGILVDKKL